MKKVLFIAVVFSQAVNADCYKAIELINKREMRGANIEFQKNCKNREFKITNEYGDKRELKDKEFWFQKVFNHYDDCLESFKNKNVRQVRSCLNKDGLMEASTFLDSNLGSNLLVDINQWKKFVETETDKANKTRKEKENEEKRIAAEKKAKEDKERKEYVDSGQNLIDQGCSLDFLSRRNEKFIERENEVGKVSGYVDKNKLHRWGSELVAFKKQLGKLQKEYTEKFGKPMSLGGCKDPFNLDQI